MGCHEYSSDQDAWAEGMEYSAANIPGISQEHLEAIRAFPPSELLQKALEDLPEGLLQSGVEDSENLLLPEDAPAVEHALRAELLGRVVTALVGPRAVIIIKDSEQR